jgi:uncharacterized protein (UPF0332 family)
MLSAIPEKAVRAHLALAEGFAGTAIIGPSEYEIRNAFSRAYYALYHVCIAYLWCTGFDVGRLRKKHGALHDAIGTRLGSSFANFLRRFYELRRKSDYIPDWRPVPGYAARAQLKAMKQHFYWLLNTAKRSLP